MEQRHRMKWLLREIFKLYIFFFSFSYYLTFTFLFVSQHTQYEINKFPFDFFQWRRMKWALTETLSGEITQSRRGNNILQSTLSLSLLLLSKLQKWKSALKKWIGIRQWVQLLRVISSLNFSSYQQTNSFKTNWYCFHGWEASQIQKPRMKLFSLKIRISMCSRAKGVNWLDKSSLPDWSHYICKTSWRHNIFPLWLRQCQMSCCFALSSHKFLAVSLCGTS